MKAEIQNDNGLATKEYEVETIRNRKVVNGVLYYLLKWKGYGEKANTWEPVSNLNCPELILEYEKLKGNTNKRWRHHSIRLDKNTINSQNSDKDQTSTDNKVNNSNYTTSSTVNAITTNNENNNVNINNNQEKDKHKKYKDKKKNKNKEKSKDNKKNNNNKSDSIFKTFNNMKNKSDLKTYKNIKNHKKSSSSSSKSSFETNEIFDDFKLKEYPNSSKYSKEEKEKKRKKHKHLKEESNYILHSPSSSNFDVIDITDTSAKYYSEDDFEKIYIKKENIDIEIPDNDDDDINFNNYTSNKLQHKNKKRKVKEKNFEFCFNNDINQTIVELNDERDVKEEPEIIDINDNSSRSFDDALYKKIYYKKLYKKNNEMTNDINIIKQVEKNIGDWISILCEEHFDKINVYNDIDLEGPPPNFKYIATCEYGKDVPRPEDITDFMIGCDCVDGCENEILCSCSVRDNYDVPISFSYNKKGEVLITRSNIIHECNVKCFCGPDCPNRVIQKNNIPYLEIFKTKNKGWGVRTKEFIRKSTFVAEYTGEIIKTDRVYERIKKDPERTHYIFDIDILGEPEYSIDAYNMGNISHFFNHSCDPNLEVYCAQCDYYEMNIFRIAFFAKRDINIDEELTFDYIGIEKPCGILKNVDHYSINTPSTISSASSIPISPGVIEDEVYIKSDVTPVKREKHFTINDPDTSQNSSCNHHDHNHQKIVININSEDESSTEAEKEAIDNRKLLKYRYNTRSQSKIQTRSKTRSKNKSQPTNKNKSKVEIEEEKNLYVVCHCGSANCRGYVYKKNL